MHGVSICTYWNSFKIRNYKTGQKASCLLETFIFGSEPCNTMGIFHPKYEMWFTGKQARKRNATSINIIYGISSRKKTIRFFLNRHKWSIFFEISNRIWWNAFYDFLWWIIILFWNYSANLTSGFKDTNHVSSMNVHLTYMLANYMFLIINFKICSW